MKKLKVAVIGQGRSGRQIHTSYLSADKRFEIAAVVDLLKKRRDMAAADYGCDVYRDYRKMLERDDLDLVVNASYSYMHSPINLAILKAGHNLLSEKPLAPHAKDVDRLIRMSKKTGKVFAIYQQSRYAPYFQQVQKVIKSGVLGRIVQISLQFNGHSRRWDWQTLTRRKGGNLLNTGPHPMDQALQLFGEGMPKVTCFMDNTEGSFGNAENHVKVLLSGKDRPLIDVEISSCCAYPPFTYQVYGSRGGLTATTSTAEWKYYKIKESPKQKLILDPIEDAKGEPAYVREDLKWHTETWSADEEKKRGATYSAAAAPTQGGMTGKFYNMLHKTLTRGRPLEITPEQVRRQIAVIEECHKQNPQIWGRPKS
ncbi:MAG: Gfo/Idh/MocA family oxidoreductase [Candidatus Latescibacteria bacterium]|jgi:predicted dehydrogenase|nr:Gfo/Idh/MocA family oxidoreductase [Candidatus Latescibacterota bacterium]